MPFIVRLDSQDKLYTRLDLRSGEARIYHDPVDQLNHVEGILQVGQTPELIEVTPWVRNELTASDPQLVARLPQLRVRTQ